MLKYKYIFQTKYTEAISSNSIRKLLWFEISKMLIAVFLKISRPKFIVVSYWEGPAPGPLSIDATRRTLVGVFTRSTQPCIPPGRLIEYQLRLGKGRECHLRRVAGNTV